MALPVKYDFGGDRLDDRDQIEWHLDRFYGDVVKMFQLAFGGIGVFYVLQIRETVVQHPRVKNFFVREKDYDRVSVEDRVSVVCSDDYKKLTKIYKVVGIDGVRAFHSRETAWSRFIDRIKDWFGK